LPVKPRFIDFMVLIASLKQRFTLQKFYELFYIIVGCGALMTVIC